MTYSDFNRVFAVIVVKALFLCGMDITDQQVAHSILFVCTGNYYRSRFAETLFNFLAEREGLPPVAFSRGLGVYKANNPGPISIYAKKRLAEMDIPLPNPVPFPVQISEKDFEKSRQVILLDEEEHRPMMRKFFPNWENKVEYWLIHDIDRTAPDEALEVLEAIVRDFFRNWAAAADFGQLPKI